MADVNIVLSERPVVGKNQYDLGVYQVGKEFYATWFCVHCPARGKTAMHRRQSEAHKDGLGLLEAHAKERHGE
jgi:hypothetical protein